MYAKTPYTPGMREVLKLAKAEAGRPGHDYIGPEHYLLGIIRKGDGLAIQTLKNLEIDLEILKDELEARIPKCQTRDGQFAPNLQAPKTLEAAKQEARSLKHNWVGTEHLFLGLVKMGHAVPGKCLAASGITYEKAAAEVFNVINGPASPPDVRHESRKEEPQELGIPCGICGSANLLGEPQLDARIAGRRRTAPTVCDVPKN